jgi:hypothetical protein
MTIYCFNSRTTYLFCYCIYFLCRCNIVNSLTAKSVSAGMKNSRSEAFLLAKHLTHTAHKHHHHDGPICPFSGMVLLDEHTPPHPLSFHHHLHSFRFFSSISLSSSVSSSTTPSLSLIILFVLSSQSYSAFKFLSVLYPSPSCFHQSFS